MVNAIPEPLKDIWDVWSIRSTLIFSLSLQTFLIFFAPQRKRTSSKVFFYFIWSAYLLADCAANFGVGQISDSQGDNSEPGEPSKNGELLAFWVPFLLLHLSGPDTITALALEDNELWLRHLLGLALQAVATFYVLLWALPNDLWIPTLLVFTTGVIKYVERTLAFYQASLDRFNGSMIQQLDPGPNYAKFMEEYTAKKDMMPTQIIKIEEPEIDPTATIEARPKDFTQLNILQYAYKYFNIFKGLLVGLIFTFQQRAESKRFFDNLTAEEALKILEVELNFMYEALYTKAEILHNWIGVIFRIFSLGCLIAALCIFQTKKKDQYGGFDVGLTYALLTGGIVLDIIALIMFCLSDWTFVRLWKLKDDVENEDEDDEDNIVSADKRLKTCFKEKLKWILGSEKLKTKPYKCSNGTRYTREHKVLNTSFMVRRWSEYVHAHNLIEYCLWIRPKRMHHTKGFIHIIVDWLTNIIFFTGSAMKQRSHQIYRWMDHNISLWCKDSKWMNEDHLKLLIYWIFFVVHLLGYVIKKSMAIFSIQAQVEEVIFTSSDRLTLDLWEHIFEEVRYKSRYADSLETATGLSSARGDWTLRDIRVENGETEIKRQKILHFVMEMDYDQSLLVWHIATEILYQTEEGTIENHSYREFSKILSDYMMYLVIMQPTLMSAVAGIGKIRFSATCEEAKRLFKRRHIMDGDAKKVINVKEASGEILSMEAPTKAESIMSNSVLFDGSMLAKALQEFKKDKADTLMWEILSKVWVELLCYAATNCSAIEHAAQLNKGGELISFVWLLMVQFGLGDHFQINQGDARSKLIVGK